MKRNSGGEMEIFAKTISIQLLEQLKEGETYKIHSRFSHGLNLEVGGRLSFIGNKEDEILPYGILLPKEELVKLDSLKSNESFLWKNGTFFMENGCLNTKQVRGYSNTLPVFSNYGEEIKRVENKKEMMDRFSYPELDTRITGFSESIRQAGSMEEDRKKELARAVVTGEGLEDVLPKWIGAGVGLTPSGDDYLTGILIANSLYGFASFKFIEEVKKYLEEGYTTDIGKNQLLCAIEGLFGSSWIGFLKAFVETDELEMKTNFYKILSYGHTSGSDMFAGFCMGLNIVENFKRCENKIYAISE